MQRAQTTQREDETGRDLRVLVVDDSALYRRVLRKVVEALPAATLVGEARNGRHALELLERTPAEFVLLDLEMPELDGLQTLAALRRRHPEISVAMVSGSTRDAADVTIEALRGGALDFIVKPAEGSPQANHQQLETQIGKLLLEVSTRRNLQRAQRLARRASSTVLPAVRGPAPGAEPPVPAPEKQRTTAPLSVAPSPLVGGQVAVVAIGVSTGGPEALARLIPALPAELPVPVLIVQHMPPVFTRSLAQSLDRASAISVREAEGGALIEPGVVYIAPGGRHMVIGDGGRLQLTDDPPVNSCRPAVDVLFHSVAQRYGGRALALVMTGMGQDGLEGVRRLAAAGARCLTQEQSTCVIYGMPKAVDDAGLSDEQLPLEAIAGRLTELVAPGAPRTQRPSYIKEL